MTLYIMAFVRNVQASAYPFGIPMVHYPSGKSYIVTVVGEFTTSTLEGQSLAPFLRPRKSGILEKYCSSTPSADKAAPRKQN